MKTNIKLGIGALLVAALLMGMVMVPTVSAQTNNGGINKESKKNNNSDNVSIQSISTTATLTVTPSTGGTSTTFSFAGSGTYEYDAYGVPLPGFANWNSDISYTAFHQPVITGSSFTNPSFSYIASSPIGPSWNFWTAWAILGGGSEYLNSHTWPKTTGSYNNRVRIAIDPYTSAQATKLVLIS
ncbi:MAG: hypothetical protein D4R88_05535 [Methanosarcinales archaeon]|nr:MAG: hypothetical protein D4R88_05535 [Methanosarcinales archaeon]